jgi:hypothetical protein
LAAEFLQEIVSGWPEMVLKKTRWERYSGKCFDSAVVEDLSAKTKERTRPSAQQKGNSRNAVNSQIAAGDDVGW